MPYNATIYRALISAPSDVTQELKAIPEVISAWNATNSLRLKSFIEPVHWKSHSHPDAGASPQDILNRQIVDESDFIIAVFWTRLGTPTNHYDSGTVEEIEKFIQSGKPVLLYFSNQPVVPGSVDTEQFNRLKEYQEKIKNKALYAEFSTVWDFRALLSRHISQVINDITNHNAGISEEATNDKKDDREDETEGLIVFLSHLGEILRLYEVDWNAEKQSTPVNTDDAKFMMEQFGNELLYVRAQITHDEAGFLSKTLDEAIALGKKIGDHQMFIDGGKSYKEFWQIGDEMIDKVKDCFEYLSCDS